MVGYRDYKNYVEDEIQQKQECPLKGTREGIKGNVFDFLKNDLEGENNNW